MSNVDVFPLFHSQYFAVNIRLYAFCLFVCHECSTHSLLPIVSGTDVTEYNSTQLVRNPLYTPAHIAHTLAFQTCTQFMIIIIGATFNCKQFPDSVDFPVCSEYKYLAVIFIFKLINSPVCRDKRLM